jgi:hypothetical protein
MATLLIGYDTESAAVGEGLARFLGPDVPQYRCALDAETTRRGVALLARLHEELEAPCTFFVCGRTLLHALDALEPVAGSDLFDIQQHTYSHVDTAPSTAGPRQCCLRRRPSRCVRSCGSRLS